MKLREAEEYQDIELSWAGRAQQPLAPALTRAASEQTQAALANAGAVQVGAGVTEAMHPSAEKAAETEPPRVEASATAAPTVVPQQEEAAASGGAEASAPSQPRKRGRPKKAEGESRAERKAPAAGEKKQKSLFDF
jgi:hypothetical protein